MLRWKKTGAFMVACLALGSVLSACAPGSNSPVDLTAKDSGSRQTLAVGQQLRVTLDANPTTGYQWSVDGSLPAQLKQVGDAVYSTQSTAIGAGGSEVWTFVGAASGTGTMKLKYWRSFEPTATPVKVFEVQADVH
ncbi:MAG: protease inhibitor I42 family protein [Coriobacteriia bacterium]|nr:protease inhibitor I42 family protein [Coriobacteriia bacterium]